MRTLFYNHYLPYRNIINDSTIETFQYFTDFKAEWFKDEASIIIIPVQVFDLVGLDIRFVFREMGRNDKKKFILIGDRKQIDFSLSQNDKFLKNLIVEIQLPLDLKLLECQIQQKIKFIQGTN